MPNLPALNEWLGARVHATPPLRRQTMLIDSRDRDSARFPSPTKYEITLPSTLHYVTSAYLIGAEIPSSYYVFTAERGNTTLFFQVDGQDYDVTLPDGNYTSDTLVERVHDLIQLALPVSVSASLTLDLPTKKAVFSSPFTSTIYGKGLAPFLGFTETVTGKTLVGARPVNPNPETYLLLDIEELGAVHEVEIKGAGGSSSLHTFAKIPITTHSFGYTFQDHTFGVNDIRPPISRLSKLRIAWRFHDGTPVDFQGVDHSVTLEFVSMDSRSV